ncbi:MAG TPA: transposase [Candidatus Angelobacter sp.]|nr:transposase [Candidatus Angelobacter sp.]
MKVRKYDYRRNLPHIELSGRDHFITFDTYLRWELPPAARDIVLKHCLHDNGTKMQLHVAVVMPDHVHMIFMPLENEKGETFSFEEIVGAIKGASVHSINKALKRSGTLWQDESFDHVIRHAESLEQKIEYVRQNPVRRGLVAKPEDYPWLWERKEEQKKK